MTPQLPEPHTVDAIIEGAIGLATVAGSMFLLNTHFDNAAMVGAASGALMLVLGFYFGQRGSTKAVNGNMAAFNQIASQLNAAAAGSAAASTAASQQTAQVLTRQPVTAQPTSGNGETHPVIPPIGPVG